jgi:hypothetical protein
MNEGSPQYWQFIENQQEERNRRVESQKYLMFVIEEGSAKIIRIVSATKEQKVNRRSLKVAERTENDGPDSEETT